MTDILQVFIAFGAGVLSFFSPCVLPLIPGYICFITGLHLEELTASSDRTFAKRRLILTEAVLFILGFSIIFVALGASATLLGSYFVAHKGLIRITGGIIIILFGLHVSGLLKIKFLEYEKKVHLRSKPVSWLGSLLVGMAFGFGWTPCVGPILGAILMLAATSDALAKGIMLLCFYSLGLALPFLLVAVGINRALNLFAKIKRYFKLISVVSGILLIIVGITILIPRASAEQAKPSKEVASDFALPGLDGQTLRLSDFKGKIVILDFWSISCPVCRRAIANFVKLYDKYKDKGLVIIGVNLDRADIDAVKRLSQSIGINYPVVKGDYALTQSYGGIRYTPTTFIIDKEMNIVKKFIGYTPVEVFESQINELLLGS
ncbi:MAG: redoxin domain-containing protein [Candidatus Omnitrophica bacterium]|nr:redoxin domain-containing protein [Candidatus Omnitrophota bacterium]